MVFKIENTQLTIDGRSVIRALIATYMFRKIYKAIREVRNEHYIIVAVEKNKEQKLSTKKSKVESK